MPEPDHPRTFDIVLAEQKLDAAGYKLDANGNRLDKQGKPISLRLDYPDTSATFGKVAQFVHGWYAQLGIKVTAQQFDSSTLGNIVLPPEAGKGYKANYDIELWDWVGNPDPNALLQVFLCNEIGSSSDSQYCNPAYDALYQEQNAATSDAARKTILAQMQNMIYDQAVYDILFYDSNLVAYRTDHFGGWQNQPLANGMPLFSYGTLDYTLLTDATAVPSPTPAASVAASTAPGATAAPVASPAPVPASSSGGDNTALYVGILVVVLVVAAGVLLVRRRPRGPSGEEE